MLGTYQVSSITSEFANHITLPGLGELLVKRVYCF